VESNGSASWLITQFSDANATVESFDIFQKKVFDLVDLAANITNRIMTVDEDSLQINTTISFDSKITEYSFIWQNFSAIQDNLLIIGDVFQVNNFFGPFGDAALQLTYPSEFSIKSASPVPYASQNSAFTIVWMRTQDLVTNKVNVVLTSNTQNENDFTSNWQFYLILVALVVGGSLLSLVGFFIFKRRTNNGFTSNTIESPIMSEEDKVLKILKTFGGSMRQSEITEQSKFSKAKTSQLLSGLEKKGSITRYMSGRDKIVTLKERVKSEKL
jgi:uncharacterized membrane protein